MYLPEKDHGSRVCWKVRSACSSVSSTETQSRAVPLQPELARSSLEHLGSPAARCWSDPPRVTSVCSAHTFVLLSRHPSSSSAHALSPGERGAARRGRLWAALFRHAPGLPDHTFAAVGACQRKDSRESQCKAGSEYPAGEEAALSFHVTHLFPRKGDSPHSPGRALGKPFPPCLPAPTPGTLLGSHSSLFSGWETNSYVPKDRCWPNDPSQPASFRRIAARVRGRARGSLSRRVTDGLFSRG